MCARQRTFFSCAHKKRRQKKAPPTARDPSLREGQPAMLASGAGPLNSLRADALHSNSRGQVRFADAIPCCAVIARPCRCASRHGHKGVLGYRFASGFAHRAGLDSARAAPFARTLDLAPRPLLAVFAIAHACGLPVLVYTLQLYFAYRFINRPPSPVYPAVAAINF